MRPRNPLTSDDARELEQLLGLQRFSLRAVERRANGDFALMFRTQRVGYRYPRTLRIPAKRVHGYRARTTTPNLSAVRARRRKNARSFAWWLEGRIGIDAPVLVRALWEHDRTAIEDLRVLIVLLASRHEHGSVGDQAERWLWEQAA